MISSELDKAVDNISKEMRRIIDLEIIEKVKLEMNMTNPKHGSVDSSNVDEVWKDSDKFLVFTSNKKAVHIIGLAESPSYDVIRSFTHEVRTDAEFGVGNIELCVRLVNKEKAKEILDNGLHLV